MTEENNNKPRPAPLTEEEKQARIARAAEARAAKAAAAQSGAEEGAAEKPERPARAPRKTEEAAPEQPKEPSKNQPFLDAVVKYVNELVGSDAIENAVINEKSGEIPTLTIKADDWLRTAETLKMNPEISMGYLRCVSGVDQESHLEVVYHLLNMTTNQELCVRVKADREQPSVPSITSLWATANWHEREIFDLLGVNFTGHPELHRIMLSDDWVGHPLRKDYEPLDPEV